MSCLPVWSQRVASRCPDAPPCCGTLAASFTHTLVPKARGYYPLGPLRLTSGDIFGLEPRVRTQPDVDHLIVYPRTHVLGDLNIPSLSLLGNMRSRSHVFDDPSHIAGVRDYQPGDSPRRIHWKISARSPGLKVKTFESTTDLKVAVFLAMDSFEGLAEEDVELVISAAASVVRYLAEKDMQTGLFVNTMSADTQSPVLIMPSAGVTSLAVMLEALAKTTYQASTPIVDFFEQQRGRLGFGGTLVFVVGNVSPAVRALQADLVRAGRDVLGFYLGGDCGDVGRHSSPWRRISRSGEPGLAGSTQVTEQPLRPETGAADGKRGVFCESPPAGGQRAHGRPGACVALRAAERACERDRARRIGVGASSRVRRLFRFHAGAAQGVPLISVGRCGLLGILVVDGRGPGTCRWGLLGGGARDIHGRRFRGPVVAGVSSRGIRP